MHYVRTILHPAGHLPGPDRQPAAQQHRAGCVGGGRGSTCCCGPSLAASICAGCRLPSGPPSATSPSWPWTWSRAASAVARIVLDPALPIRPGIVAIDSGCRQRAGRRAQRARPLHHARRARDRHRRGRRDVHPLPGRDTFRRDTAAGPGHAARPVQQDLRMSDILSLVLNIALAIHVALIAVCVWRVWRGENVIDRLIGADLVGTLMLAVLVLDRLDSGECRHTSMWRWALAALGFVGTIALAKVHRGSADVFVD